MRWGFYQPHLWTPPVKVTRATKSQMDREMQSAYMSTGNVDPKQAELQYDLIVKALQANDVETARKELNKLPKELHQKVKQRLLTRQPPLPADALKALYGSGGGFPAWLMIGGLVAVAYFVTRRWDK